MLSQCVWMHTQNTDSEYRIDVEKVKLYLGAAVAPTAADHKVQVSKQNI